MPARFHQHCLATALLAWSVGGFSAVAVAAPAVADAEPAAETTDLVDDYFTQLAEPDGAQAAAAVGSWRLEGCTLYVTLEPCPMCAGAILQARVPWVVWGAADPKAGAVESLYRLFEDPRLNHRVDHVGRVLADECGRILSEFFRGKR